MLYRIFTEDKNRNEVEDIISKYFPGFTIISATGYYEGQKENSLIIELAISAMGDINKVYRIARLIKENNNQEVVMVQKISDQTKFI